MNDFGRFVAANKERLFALAEQNTKRNRQGRAVIERGDTWRTEDVWDDFSKELSKLDEPARSLVR